MKRLLLIVSILLPALLNAQPKPGQKNKSIFEFLRPLHGDADNFEKGLAHHNQTFHNGKDPVDIYEELTGDQTGEYAFVYRNFYTWSDVKNTTQAAENKDHAADWDQNVAKYAESNSPRVFYEMSEDSYLPPDMSNFNTDIQGVYLLEPTPGKEDVFYAGLKKIKEMYKKTNSKNYYIIQNRIFGKGNQTMVAFPLPEGWKSFEPDPANEWPVMFKKAFPNEDYKAWNKKFSDSQKSFDSFVVKWRKDLSSPM